MVLLLATVQKQTIEDRASPTLQLQLFQPVLLIPALHEYNIKHNRSPPILSIQAVLSVATLQKYKIEHGCSPTHLPPPFVRPVFPVVILIIIRLMVNRPV